MQRKLFALLILGLSLSGCVHKVTIEQGNIITQDMVNQLHPGMTSDQVQFILGHPVLVETFEANRADYVYTLETNGTFVHKKRLTLFFKDGHLSRIDGTMHPELNPTTKTTPLPINPPSVPIDTSTADPNPHVDTAPTLEKEAKVPLDN